MSTHSAQTYHKSSTKKPLRAAKARLIVVAALVGVLAAAAPVPAQAHSRLDSGSFSFNFSFGIGGTQSAPDRFRVGCMSIWIIKDNMRSQGYRDVQYLGEWRFNRPEFSGIWNGWRYTMEIDRCTGQASNVQRVGRASRWPNSPFSNSFFEWFQLNRQRH